MPKWKRPTKPRADKEATIVMKIKAGRGQVHLEIGLPDSNGVLVIPMTVEQTRELAADLVRFADLANAAPVTTH